MRCFDAFAGVGGFTLGVHDALPNTITVGFSEIDKHASAVLRHRFPKVKNYGDITALTAKDLPDFDLFTFGSPCQDFSIAGKRAGIGGARSGLFLRAIEVIREKKPAHFIFENVKGMLSSNRGWDFGRAILEMEASGYSLSIHLLNAKDFGVPQNRERVFVIGTRTDRTGEILPLRENDGLRAGPAQDQKEVHDVASTLTARQYASWGGQPCEGNDPRR